MFSPSEYNTMSDLIVVTAIRCGTVGVSSHSLILPSKGNGAVCVIKQHRLPLLSNKLGKDSLT